MKFIKLLLAALLFSAALYIFLLGPESRMEALASIGIHVKHTTAIVLSIQSMVLGIILGVKAIFDEKAVRKSPS